MARHSDAVALLMLPVDAVFRVSVNISVGPCLCASLCVCLVLGQDFLQVLSIFASFDFEWPPALVKLYTAFSLAGFNLELLAPECRFELAT